MIMLIVNVDLMFALDILNFHCCLIITMPIMSELDHGLRKGKNLCMCRADPLAGCKEIVLLKLIPCCGVEYCRVSVSPDLLISAVGRQQHC